MTNTRCPYCGSTCIGVPVCLLQYGAELLPPGTPVPYVRRCEGCKRTLTAKAFDVGTPEHVAALLVSEARPACSPRGDNHTS